VGKAGLTSGDHIVVFQAIGIHGENLLESRTQ
jgi:hypothetical protein